jgi:hypothetical protein
MGIDGLKPRKPNVPLSSAIFSTRAIFCSLLCPEINTIIVPSSIRRFIASKISLVSRPPLHLLGLAPDTETSMPTVFACLDLGFA